MKNMIYLSLLVVLVSCYSREPVKSGIKGDPIPEFKLFLVDSSTYFNTTSLPAGKPVVMFFFGPYCPYSKAQMEMIVDKMNSLQHIEFLVFTTWSFKHMKSFYQRYKINNYTNIKMGLDYENFFWKHFSIKSVPFLVIYGRDGKLREIFSGQVPINKIKKAAES
jgi:hypothetical protein